MHNCFRPGRKLRALLAPAFLAAMTASPALATEADEHDAGSVAWRVKVDMLAPIESHRPIDIYTATGERVWQGPLGFEGGLGAGVLIARGERADPGEPLRNSDTEGLVMGGTVRWAPLSLGSLRPFVEGSARFLYTFGDPFPDGGSAVNGFVTWGGGVVVHASPSLSFEAGYHRAHVSNGGGLVPYNPAWNGRGGFVGLTWHPGR